MLNLDWVNYIMYGEGVTKDYKEAKYWMQKAAMNGHTNAEEWLRTH